MGDAFSILRNPNLKVERFQPSSHMVRSSFHDRGLSKKVCEHRESKKNPKDKVDAEPPKGTLHQPFSNTGAHKGNCVKSLRTNGQGSGESVLLTYLIVEVSQGTEGGKRNFQLTN